MIQVQLPTYMWCEEQDCKASQPAVLFLTATGGFSFRPASDNWQIMIQSNGSGPVLCRCPLHKEPERRIQTAGVIPTLERIQ